MKPTRSDRRLRFAALVLLALVVMLAGCAQVYKAPVGPPHPTPGMEHAAEATGFRVGTARVDITPPPGAATWGHAPDSLISVGFWTRLECRVFFFHTDDDRRLVLVPCDLQSTSHLLHRWVAQRLARTSPGLVAGTRIFISATHTHAGPGHYWEGDAYGGPTSSRFPGFDEQMLDFLANGIADGIETAAAHAQPAKLRHLKRGDVWGLSRNRSIDAYHLNAKTWTPPTTAPFPPGEREDHLRIDPTLDVLEIVPASGRPQPNGAMGAITFFAMHPTVLSALNHVFGADVFGVASRSIERELRRELATRYPECANGACAELDPLGPIVNGNEGDLVPIHAEDEHEQVLTTGAQLADFALELLGDTKTPFTAKAAIDARYLEIDMQRAWVTVPGANGERQTKLCTPTLGQAATRGATDHRAATEYLFPDATDTEDCGACDAPKAVGMGGLQGIIAPPSAYPRWVALGLVRFDDMLVAFVPGELTMTSGHLIDDEVTRIWRELVGEPSTVRIGGLTNAYIQYVATPDEYRYQAYEGASTLYGPNTILLFVDRFRFLARSLAGHGSLNRPGTYLIDELPEITFDVAVQRPRFARPGFNVSLDELDAKHRRKITAACRLHGTNPQQSCVLWRDGGPGVVWRNHDDPPSVARLRAGPWVSLVTGERTVTTCGEAYGTKTLGPNGACDPRARMDDFGTEFLVRTTGPSCPDADGNDDGSWQWVALFTPKAHDWQDVVAHGPVRFRIASDKAHVALETAPFEPTSPLPECDDVQTRLCTKESPPECHPEWAQ